MNYFWVKIGKTKWFVDTRVYFKPVHIYVVEVTSDKTISNNAYDNVFWGGSASWENNEGPPELLKAIELWHRNGLGMKLAVYLMEMGIGEIFKNV